MCLHPSNLLSSVADPVHFFPDPDPDPDTDDPKKAVENMGVVDESMRVVDENLGVVDRTAVGVVDGS